MNMYGIYFNQMNKDIVVIVMMMIMMVVVVVVVMMMMMMMFRSAQVLRKTWS